MLSNQPGIFEYLIQIIMTIVVTLIASNGFWSFIQKKNDNKIDEKNILKGLAHSKIIEEGMEYIQRGWITKDEYQDFFKYLYDPYSEIGGNGLARKIAYTVKDLPIYKGDSLPQMEKTYDDEYKASHSKNK